MKQKRAVGFGAGGHAKVVIEILQLVGEYELVGLLDADPALVARSILGVRVLGDDRLVPTLLNDGVTHFFMGVGSTRNSDRRRHLFERALKRGLAPIVAVHPRAYVSASASIGGGTVIMAGAIVNPCATIGTNVIVNTGAIVEHDCEIADHVHIATGARLTGSVRIGVGAHVGAGATIRQSLSIGAESVVGAGAVVVTDVPPRVLVVGVPARVLKAVDGASWVARVGAAAEGT